MARESRPREMNRDWLNRDIDDDDFRCQVSYTNSLPDVPFDSKFTAYPFDPKRFVVYRPTMLDKNFKHDILIERDVEICFNLMDPHSLINGSSESMELDPIDEILCEPDDESERSTHHRKVPWMRRPEYVSISKMKMKMKQLQGRRSSQPSGVKLSVPSDFVSASRGRERQLEVINKTFEDIKTVDVSKPGVTVVEEMPIFPDFDMWKLACAQVIFDVDPAAPESSNVPGLKTESYALIRGMTDENDQQFVAYLLPTENTCRKLSEKRELTEDDHLVLEYKLFRQYNWLLKSKATPGYEESYFFNIRNGAAYYNELETRVHLSRRKLTKTTSALIDSRITVNYRPLNQVELEAQEVRRTHLEPIIIEEEDDVFDGDQTADKQDVEHNQVADEKESVPSISVTSGSEYETNINGQSDEDALTADIEEYDEQTE